MANQPESPNYDAGVYQLEIVDSVDGGVGAKSNAPLLSLANRTAYLKQHLDALESGSYVPTGFALLNSPSFTGSPTAPTQAAGDNTTRLANTAFVQTAVDGTVLVDISGAATTTLTQAQYGPAVIKLTGAVAANKAVVFPNLSGRWQVINNSTGAFTVTLKTAAGSGVILSSGMSSNIYCDGSNITLQQTDFVSTDLTGVPTAPTAAAGTNSAQLATTAFVAAMGAQKADLSSPALTGAPTAPTAAFGANTGQIANAAFVQSAISALVASAPASLNTLAELAAAIGNDPNFVTNVNNGLASKQPALGYTPVQQGTGVGQLGNLVKLGWSPASKLKATVDSTDLGNVALENWVGANYAPLYSPNMSGVPTAPTAGAGTNNAQVATTAFVAALGAQKADLAGFARSMGANGFQKLPYGTIIQWGYGQTDANGNATIAFTAAFPNALLGFMVCGRWVAPQYPLVAGTTTLRNNAQAGVMMSYNGSPISAGFDYYAVGY
ncbi:hypothetical protein [Pseudomonas sp. Q1]|uniref:gp53-like domain-containing protein n=1 Tax=Pseudomonas sp. Q1 TaxID=2202823 RepID=UPI001374D2A8|nr:hypothetical protein [Pseudomonas sp. Q1]NCE85284.1 hypothetical protein [Pseudomonas sp. Q1]